MDFNQLMTRMRELDQPTTEAGCGMDAPMAPPPLSAAPPKPDTPPPSMSVNINAQGMENIEDMMKLFTKVNPDMMPPAAPPMPSLTAEPKITSIKPSMPPLKMLPDLDADNDDMPGGEKDAMMKMGLDKDDGDDMDSDYDKDGKLDAHEKDHADEKPLLKSLDLDKDGDHDMDDHDMEKKDKEEAFMNEPDEEEKSVDYMNNKLAGGMNRPKDTFPKVSDGDNPMKKNKFESGDLRAQIRAELQQRLAESKTAQLDEGPLDMLKKAGGAVKGAFKGAVTGAKKAMATPGGGTARSKQAFGKVVKAPAGGVGVSPAGGVGVSPAQTPGAQSAQTQQPSPGRKQAADALIGLASTLQSGKTSSGADYGLDDIATDLEDLAKDMRENPQDYDSVAKSGGVK